MATMALGIQYYIGWFLCMAQVRFLEICVLIVLPLLVHDASYWLRPWKERGAFWDAGGIRWPAEGS